MGALSLLSIASHHRDYRTHNSLTMHNSRVVARNTPALPEQRVLAFASGTRVVVRDLFGSMPVRVKQRAIEVERLGSSRDFDRLLHDIVSLLLAWPVEVTVNVQDSYARRTVSLHASSLTNDVRRRATANGIISRTRTLLSQASLVDRDDLDSWVSIGATASGISVKGCVSLRPVATKRVQFIALGIQPLPNEGHQNILYEEVNRVFADSSFGVVEEADFGDDGHPVKSEGFTGRQLKPKRGIDRWPMFFLQITLQAESETVGVDELLEQRGQCLAIIIDLLQVMSYEFLKKHHFRPRSVAALERLKRQKPSPSVPDSLPTSGSSTSSWDQTHRRAKRADPQRDSPKLSSFPCPSRSSPATRLASPFAFWSRIKHTAPEPGSKVTAASSEGTDRPRVDPHSVSSVPDTITKTTSPHFDRVGNLLRKPFDDEDEGPTGLAAAVPSSQPPREPSVTESGTQRETVVWVDPTTKIRSLIDRRTGFEVKSGISAGNRQAPRVGGAKDITQLLKRKPPSGYDNPVFHPTEPAIPHVLQVSEPLGCEHGGRSWRLKDFEVASVESPAGNSSTALEGRILKAALRDAEILGQVDRKFILVKTSPELSTDTRSRVNKGDRMLVLIDQHAADERCRVEEILETYFVSDPTGGGRLVAQTQDLERPLRCDLARQDVELLARFGRHFTHWGIVYQVMHDPSQNGASNVTVEVQKLPPSILERCRLEPRLLVDLLRKEIWKLRDAGRLEDIAGNATSNGWVARFHNCPEGILDMINSRACRSEPPVSNMEPRGQANSV